jgi:hypothetical protein
VTLVFKDILDRKKQITPSVSLSLLPAMTARRAVCLVQRKKSDTSTGQYLVLEQEEHEKTCILYFWNYRATNLSEIKKLNFAMVKCCVFFAVRTEFLLYIYMGFGFKGLKALTK